MWLVATLVHSTTLQNTHMIQIRMKVTKNEVGTSWGREYCVGRRTEVTPLENVMKLDLLLWAPAAHPLGATIPVYTVFRFAFLLPIVPLG